MPDIPAKDVRECCISAMAGNHAAARVLLNMFGWKDVASEVRKGHPFSNRVRRAVDCLGAGCGDPNWEVVHPDGSIENLVWSEPHQAVRYPIFDEE